MNDLVRGESEVEMNFERIGQAALVEIAISMRPDDAVAIVLDALDALEEKAAAPGHRDEPTALSPRAPPFLQLIVDDRVCGEESKQPREIPGVQRLEKLREMEWQVGIHCLRWSALLGGSARQTV